jgi:hypothetical protein
MTEAPGERSAGDALPARCRIIEVHVGELRELFNSIDPSPFHRRDLDPRAEEFIVGWARDLPRDSQLALQVLVDRGPGAPDEAATLRRAIHEFFGGRAGGVRRLLRELFRRGRISLAIGLAFLAASIAAGGALLRRLDGGHLAEIVRESLLIGGWVAMWRPLEIFLYDWWPLRADARLYDRLGAMPVRLVYAADASAEAWRSDWPAMAPSGRPQGAGAGAAGAGGRAR